MSVHIFKDLNQGTNLRKLFFLKPDKNKYIDLIDGKYQLISYR